MYNYNSYRLNSGGYNSGGLQNSPGLPSGLNPQTPSASRISGLSNYPPVENYAQPTYSQPRTYQPIGVQQSQNYQPAPVKTYKRTMQQTKPITPYIQPDQNDPNNFGGWETWHANNPTGTFEQFKTLIALPTDDPNAIHGGTGVAYEAKPTIPRTYQPIGVKQSQNYQPAPVVVDPQRVELVKQALMRVLQNNAR